MQTLTSVNARVQCRLAVQAKAPRAMRAQRLIVRAAEYEKVLQDVRTVVAEQLGKPLEKVQARSDFFNDLQADSLDVVELMLALEEKFGIPLEDERTVRVATVRDAAELITNLLNQK